MEGTLDKRTYLAEPCQPPSCLLPAHQENTPSQTHTQTLCGLLLQSHKVTECQYKRTQSSDKWDLACSINSAAKSLLLSIAEPYLSAVGLGSATKAC